MLIGLGIADTGTFGPADAEFWVLALLVLVGELFPIQVHGQVGEETFSTPFATIAIRLSRPPSATTHTKRRSRFRRMHAPASA